MRNSRSSLFASFALLPVLLVAAMHIGVHRSAAASSQGSAQPGELLWTFDGGDWVDRNGESEDGQLFIESIGEDLFALNADTGNWRWHIAAEPGSTFSEATVVDDVAYVGSTDKTLYALDVETGVEHWHLMTGNSIYTPPVVVNGVVYIQAMDAYLYALNSATGAELWRFALDEGSSSVSVDAVVDGVVYAHTWTGIFYSLDATSGRERWRYETGCNSCGNHLEVTDDAVLISNYATTLTALDPQDGTPIWNKAADGWRSTFTVFDGIAYFGADDLLYALDAATGSELWKFPTSMESQPVVLDGVLYFGDEARRLYALDAKTGLEQWHFLMKYPHVSAPPTVADGVLYISDADTFLYAIDVNSGAALWDFAIREPSNGTMTYQAPVIADGVVIYKNTDDSVIAVAM